MPRLGLASGQTPQEGKRAHQRRTPTLAEVSQRFLSERASRLKPRTLVNYELYFRIHALPHLGGAKLDAITPGDLAHLHRRIGQTKPVTANRVIRAVGSLYRYAGETGLVESGFNPTSGIKAFREHPHDRYLAIEELERLGAALREGESQGLPWDFDEAKPTSKHAPKRERRTILGLFAVAAIRLLLFTGCRLRENPSPAMATRRRPTRIAVPRRREDRTALCRAQRACAGSPHGIAPSWILRHRRE